jgi:hypothetical protein
VRGSAGVDLVPLRSVDASGLRWQRTGEDPVEYTLRAGPDPVLVLRWATASRSLATAETTDARWTLKRGGFLNPHLTLRAAGAETDLARITVHLSYHKGGNYHRIEFDGARVYRFHRAGVQLPAWQISSDDGTELIHLEPVREGTKLTDGAAVVSPPGRESPDLAALLAFSWYFVVLAWFEDESLLPFERALADIEQH